MCVESIDKADIRYKKIVEHWPARQITHDFAFLYPGQTPNIAVLLISGSAILRRKKKVETVFAPVLIAFDNLLAQKNIDCEVTLISGSKACMIDRASLLTQNIFESAVS